LHQRIKQRAWAVVTDERKENYGMIGWVGRVDHNDVTLHFNFCDINCEGKSYHAMSIELVKDYE